MIYIARRNRERGSVYIVALVTLVVAVTLGLAMLRVIGADFRNQDALNRKQAALNLAEAGYDYAVNQMLYKGRSTPFTADLTLSIGTIHVEVTDDSSRSASSRLVTSTGTSGGYRQVIKRAYVVMPYQYAWCENTALTTDKQIVCTGLPGGMRVNGAVNLNRVTMNVTTGVWSSSTITSVGTVTPRHPNSPVVAFPSIDYNYYSSNADITYVGDRNFWNLSSSSPIIIYVNGKAILNGGTYNGMITIVATGDINVKGNYTKWDASSYLAFITTQHINVEGAVTLLEAVMYSHKSDNNGQVHFLANLTRTFRGVAAADNVDNDSYLNMDRDSSLTPSIMRQLRLPGYQESY